GLAAAIELAHLARAAGGEQRDAPHDVRIAVLEKAGALGEHCLSGAVVNPRALRELFPDVPEAELPLGAPVQREAVYYLTRSRAIRVPTPPTMRNHGNHVASLCELVRWMGDRAAEIGVDILTGFPAASLLVSGDRVVGVRTTPSGLERDGTPGPGYTPPVDVTARVVVLAEGTRGALAQKYVEWQGIRSYNPQIYALGVKELWETPKALDRVVHTLGWPLPRDAFGGSFLYPIEPNVLALGLVVGLDHHDQTLDVHELLQAMKQHPLFRGYLDGGELLEWGAKTIPEGGYLALPERRSGDGIVLVGDCAGFVDVPSLKGIHYAIQTGIFAARAVFDGLAADDVGYERLRAYDAAVNGSYVIDDLYRRRNMRAAFSGGFWTGALKAMLMTWTGGRLPGKPIRMPEDAAVPKRISGHVPGVAGGRLSITKADAVFRSGNATRDDVPRHLILPDRVPEPLARLYQHMCPAAVYESREGGLVTNPANCIDCKATDVLGPRWTPREGGSGPRYRRM
ncbi:MAG TPA: electron-transfer flavoprotein:ubiquinone oxidoreductase, partial [Longimicrobiales bacterium]|nr:electron-transfer flavoprotein:ubiquinone oxidoreductase [Longimicrobiales bacterium]